MTEKQPYCFVIQPFDNGEYDERYKQIYKPAIETAGLVAYRVDEDHNVDIPIETIEEGIRKSVICFADISEDNPNVWYELGYAFACGKRVVMACKEGRNLPFDIQRNRVNFYNDTAISGVGLKNKITEEIKAKSSNNTPIKEIVDNSKSDLNIPINKKTPDLNELDVGILYALFTNIDSYEVSTLIHDVNSSMVIHNTRRIQNTKRVKFSIRKLEALLLIERESNDDFGGWNYFLTKAGKEWCTDNEPRFEKLKEKDDDGHFEWNL